MANALTRRQLAAPFLVALATGAFGLTRPETARAGTLPIPRGKPILTISGRIVNSNSGDTAIFDRAMLEGLGIITIETHTPWYHDVVRFDGVPMEALMKIVGASGDTVTAIALNDYISEIPMADFSKYGVILALKRDGQYMPIRDKGPLFIVYPYDSRPELQSQQYYSRSAWQISKLVVK